MLAYAGMALERELGMGYLDAGVATICIGAILTEDNTVPGEGLDKKAEVLALKWKDVLRMLQERR